MSVEAASKTSLITDQINALEGRTLSEFERRALKRDIETLKAAHLYDYHMLMGIFSALTDSLPKVLEHHEKSLAGGHSIYYSNFAYSLRQFNEHHLSLQYLLEALSRDIGSFKLFDDVCLAMIHAADFSHVEALVEQFAKANPNYDLSKSRHFMNIISMREALRSAGVSERDYSVSKGIVDKIVNDRKIVCKMLAHNLRFSGQRAHVSVQMLSKDVEPEVMAEVNCCIAEAMVESGLESWDKVVFMLANVPSEKDETLSLVAS